MSDYIHPEVLSEILKRLPIKCLLRLRCVCRTWCTLISNPSFISQHLSYLSSSSPDTRSLSLVRYHSTVSNREIYTLFSNDDDTTLAINSGSNIPFPFHDEAKRYYHVVGCCDGVLCLSDDLFGMRDADSFVLWNPSVRRALTLPAPCFHLCGGGSILALGFGSDSEKDDYKVVRMAYLLNDERTRHVLPPAVEVFSLSTGAWKHLDNDVGCYVSDHFWSQAFVHGAVHWVAFRTTENRGDRKRHWNSLLRFDLTSERFAEVGLPEALAGVPPVKMVATTVRGRLSVVYNDIFMDHSFNNDNDGSCLIWVMREYDDVKSWSLIFKVKSGLDLYRVLDVKKTGIMFAGRGELSFYNFQKKVATKTGTFGTTYSFFMDRYVESLVLVGHGKGVSATEPEFDCENYENMRYNVHGDESRILCAKTEQIYSLYLTA